MDDFYFLGAFTVTLDHKTSKTSIARRFSATIQIDSPIPIHAHIGRKRIGKLIEIQSGTTLELKQRLVPFTKPLTITFIVDSRWYLACRFFLNNSGDLVVRFVSGYEHMLPR
jgi:hypothetical protein